MMCRGHAGGQQIGSSLVPSPGQTQNGETGVKTATETETDTLAGAATDKTLFFHI